MTEAKPVDRDRLVAELNAYLRIQEGSENFRSIIPMHRSRPLANTFTATLKALWVCAYCDFKPQS